MQQNKNMDTQNLNEFDMKVRLLDYLVSEQDSVIDDVIACEVPFADYKRRADVVRINGCLHGYEIKSDLDSLVSLQKQISDYTKTFEKVSVVLTKTHLENARKILPKSVGIILIGNKTTKSLRQASHIKRLDKYFLSCFLDRAYINHRFKQKGILNNSLKKLNMFEIRDFFASKVKTEEIKKIVIKTLKEKYQDNFRHFLKHRGNITHWEDLVELKKGQDTIQSFY